MSDTKARISAYLPGGTATAIMGKWSSRIMVTGSDTRQGRWSWVRLQGNTDNKGKCTNIRLINTYRVCQAQVTDGSFTSYMHQYTVQQSEGNPTPYPRTQVIEDLTKFIQDCKEQGDEIILCMDANEELEEGEDIKKGTITSLTQANELICAYEYLGDKSGTSESSDKRINFMLVTPGVLLAIIRGGKRPYSEGIASDHRTLYLDLDGDTLFGKKTGEMDTNKARNLDTKYPKSVAK